MWKIILLSFILTGSAIASLPASNPAPVSDSQLSSDGYSFEEKEFTNLTPKIKVILYQTEKQLQQDYVRETHDQVYKNSSELMAWSSVPNGDGVCVIHIVDPAKTYLPEIIGHEFTHCLFGEFHPKKSKALGDS